MVSIKNKQFPDWDTFYKENEIEKMPWYEKDLDLDVEHEIKSKNIRKGRFLDVGTGPGTQAIQLAKLGFDVTGVDISETAIQKAKQQVTNVSFVKDNFLDSKLTEHSFDFVLDRGCFHVCEPSQRQRYVEQVYHVLDKKGILFLKCFSVKETKEKGPYKFSRQDITDIFSKYFEIKSIKDTVYYGTLNPLPKALFAVMKKKGN